MGKNKRWKVLSTEIENKNYITCRWCSIRFFSIGNTASSSEKCCSTTCLDKAGPWMPIHGPKPKPKGYKSPDEQAIARVAAIEASKANRRKKDRSRTGHYSYANDPFFGSKEWQELRYKALVTYGAVCMLCRTQKGSMHVDHIKPRSKFPHLALEFDNLQILCKECNRGKSNKSYEDFRPKTSSPTRPLLCECCQAELAKAA